MAGAETTGQMRGVALLGASAVAFRMFVMAAIDTPGVYSSGWLSALASGALSLPAALPALLNRRTPGGEALRGSAAGRLACALLAALTLYDAAVSARLFAGMASCSALGDRSTRLLALPLVGTGAAVCLLGTGALAATAVVWRRVAVCLAALIALSQAGRLEPLWLWPPLGPGAGELARGAERLAGCASPLALGVYVLGGDRPRGCARALAWGTGVAALAALLLGMLIPAMPGETMTRLFRIEMLTDSGRGGLAAELTDVLMTFGGVALVSFEMTTAAAALKIACPAALPEACALLCGAGTLALVFSPLSAQRAFQAAAAWYYPWALAAALLAALAAGRRRAKA